MSHLAYFIELAAYERQLQFLREAKTHRLVNGRMAGKARAHRPGERRIRTLVNTLRRSFQGGTWVTAYNNYLGRYLKPRGDNNSIHG
jgi:hypothetical protein